MKTLLRIGAALVVLGLVGARAGAAEIAVLSAGAMRSVIAQLAPEFERGSGSHLMLAYGTAGEVEKRVAAGEPVDVVLLTKPRIETLQGTGKIVPGSVVVLGRSPIGLAVRQGAPKPDISSVEATKRALLAAGSIAYTDPASGGTSGIHITREFERLGLAAELQLKLRPISGQPGQPPAVGAAVALGEAEIGLQPISELYGVPGIDIVGTLPAAMQTPDLTYAAGLGAAAGEPAAGKALIAFLAGPAAAEIIKSKGLVPGDGR